MALIDQVRERVVHYCDRIETLEKENKALQVRLDELENNCAIYYAKGLRMNPDMLGDDAQEWMKADLVFAITHPVALKQEQDNE